MAEHVELQVGEERPRPSLLPSRDDAQQAEAFGDHDNIILEHDDDAWRDNLVRFLAKLTAATSTLYTIINVAIGFYALALFNFLFLVAYTLILSNTARGQGRNRATLLLFLATAQVAFSSLIFLPTSTGTHYFLMVVPVFALTAARPGHHTLPTLISIFGISVGGFLELEQQRYVAPLQHHISHIDTDMLRAFAGVLAVVLSFTICRAYYRQLGSSYKLFSQQQLLIRTRMLQRREEESEELRTLLRNVRTPIVGINKEALIDEWNEAASLTWSLNHSEAAGKDAATLLNSNRFETLSAQIRSASDGVPTKNSEHTFQIGGAKHQVLVSSTPRTDSTSDTGGCWLICQDICALRNALTEKELLLKEVHHRVKNNLQIISSLLNIQRDQSQSLESREHLEESASRVRAMALIHQQLYASSSLARVDFNEYARALATQLRALLSPQAQFLFDGSSVELPVDTAVPCGLILNELVTNALKYGVSADGSCKVHVEVGQHDDFLLLVVKDEGPGLATDATPTSPTTLGFQLIQGLSRQIRATCELGSIDANQFSIRVPLKKPVFENSAQRKAKNDKQVAAST